MGAILVIGYGSIGSRHVRVALELGHTVHVVSRRGDVGGLPCHQDIAAAVSSRAFDVAVVATETGRHEQDVASLARSNFAGRVLIEKPLAASEAQALQMPEVMRNRIFVAYNLRHHPVIQELRVQLEQERILNVSCHVGQDLSQWRSGRAVGDTYSSRRDGGGGVLRDLSHELDYMVWLFGPWASVAAIGGKVGDMPGDADDCWAISIRFASGAVGSVGLDYFCRHPIRRILVNTSRHTVEADLISAQMIANGTQTWDVARDDTYRAQLEALLTPSPSSDLCSFEDGLATNRLIGAIEQAAHEGRTIYA